jgi:hypothetical protein
MSSYVSQLSVYYFLFGRRLHRRPTRPKDNKTRMYCYRPSMNSYGTFLSKTIEYESHLASNEMGCTLTLAPKNYEFVCLVLTGPQWLLHID